jgi:signal transduction histidine kinase
MQLALICFVNSFPENGSVDWTKAAWAAAPMLIFVPLLLMGKLWQDVGFRNDQFYIGATPYAYALAVYVHAMLGYAVWVLIRKHRQYRHQLFGRHTAFVLGAVLTTAILASVATVILPFFNQYGLLAYASIFIVFGILLYAYAITNFKLFSVQSVLDHLRLFPLTYKIAITVTSVGLIGFLLLQIPIVWWSFGPSDTIQWKRYLVFSLISGMVPCLTLIFLIVRALSRPLRTITEAAVEVSQGKYGVEIAHQSNDEIGVLVGAFNEMSRKLESDIAHLKQMNEGLVRTEKLATAGVLAAGVAHEVNNPLASISSLAQIMLRREGDENRKETLRTILSQIDRISQILRDLMEFAQPRQPCRTHVNLNKVIENSLRLVSVDKQFKQLKVTTELDPSIPLTDVDQDQMQQVFLNLFLNARDAMPNGGQLIVTTRYDVPSESAVVEVADTGAGIRADLQDRIFDPFFTTKQQGKGTGLGLSVCYGIITAHGGEIKAVVDTHTRFVIKLKAESAKNSGTDLQSVRLQEPAI